MQPTTAEIMTVDTTPIKQYIETHLTQIKGREDVAKFFGLPLEGLRKAFSEAEGQALADFITEARVEEAKRLLRKTNLTSKEICYAVGFARVDSGERAFKEATGLTMQAYRKRYRKQ